MKKAALTIGLLVGIFWTVQVSAGGLFKKGTTEWSFSTGFGRNFHVKGHHRNVQEDIKFLPVLVSWSKVYKELAGGESLEYAVEGIVSYARQENEDTYMAGVTPNLIFNFKNHEKLIPYIDLGLGIVVTNLYPEGFGGDWGFSPQIGVGFRYAIETTNSSGSHTGTITFPMPVLKTIIKASIPISFLSATHSCDDWVRFKEIPKNRLLPIPRFV